MVNKVEGVREGKQQILTCSLMIERDLVTGLMAIEYGRCLSCLYRRRDDRQG